MRAACLLMLCAVRLPAQELIANYLGGTQAAQTSFDAPVTGTTALGVSADGRWLYAAQAARGLVLRYDLRERTMEPIPVTGIPAGLTTIVVDNDGTALVPQGGGIARIGMDGKLTAQGIPYPPATSASTAVAVMGRLLGGPTRTAIVGGFGVSANLRSPWLHVPPTSSNRAGSIDSCFSGCDNSALAADSPAGRFRANQLWGFALGEGLQYPAYFTDSGALRREYGSVARLLNGNVTLLAHSKLAGIPQGTSGLALCSPTGLALDANGNLLVADTCNHRILRRTAAGVWSVFAGTGVRGNRGDGGPASAAEFFEPQALAVDGSGALYIHDSGNGTLRRVLPNGTMERVNSGGGASETLIGDLPLPFVTAMTTDRLGQIYAASQGRIVRVDPRGRAAYIAGTGEFGRAGEDVPALESPIGSTAGMAVDGEGRLLWSEQYRIRRLEPSGRVVTAAGTGTERPLTGLRYDPDPAAATAAYLRPTALWTAPDGSVLISDVEWIRRLRGSQISSLTGVPWCEGYAEGIPAIFACSGHAGSSLFTMPDGSVLFDAESRRTVRSVDPQGYIKTLARPQDLRVRAMAPGPGGYVYALVDRLLSAPANAAGILLLRIAPDGGTAVISNQTRAALQAGQNTRLWGMDSVDVITSDNRGFVYVWDPVSRRIVVIGERSVVTVDSEPSGREVLVDGTAVQTPRVFEWLPGEYHTVEAAEGTWSHGEGRTVTWMPPAGQSRVVAQFE